ncbi:hemicentin-1-like isoform X2 [Betta splendens]|uniref:Hemicentin-1-like isoform X2 n=1 Tax=Betta splendens TaxID=158456 RepID=A0A9W2XYG5_BETSP|nr:hemicentin-1-like isoform X2 [Betta splendens]
MPGGISAALPVQLSPHPFREPGESADGGLCPLTLTPSALVVRFGDPVTVNCSASTPNVPGVGWVVSLGGEEKPEFSMTSFLVWGVKSLTDWSITPVCFTLVEQGGQCQRHLSLIIYKPPSSVSMAVLNHSGPLLEGGQYTLLCTVHDVAPVQNLAVTFYRGHTALGRVRSNATTKTPVTETFSLDIVPSKEDDGVQYWCEARLELGPAGPQRPPAVVSPKLTSTVHFGPQLTCPAKLWVKEGERLGCEVRGNPPPLVNWYRDGENVTLPTRSKRWHSGRYTVCAEGVLGHKEFTVEVEVLPTNGSAAGSSRGFLLGVLLIQFTHWL